MAAICVSNLGKAYKTYPKRWSRLAEWILPFSPSRHALTWVLRDVSFSVEAGEAVGIVGVNGAGKSTLLKLIAGTNQPTQGAVSLGGRVSALLELGTGFHPQFTGRQNVVMAAQMQGLDGKTIEAMMSGIQAFADIGSYFDQPLRVYSSGMYVRLAFAVATATRPEILIVDEALSVGDAAFQRKCFRRIEDYRADGTTLLFVSHSIESVKRLCDRAIHLHGGKLQAIGSAKEVCDQYEQMLFGGKPLTTGAGAPEPIQLSGRLDPALNASGIERQYGDGGARIVEVGLRDQAGNLVNVLPEGAPFSVRYRVEFDSDTLGVEFGMMIKNAEGACLYATNTTKWQQRRDFHRGTVAMVDFALQGNLVPGIYYLNVGVTHCIAENSVFLHRRIDCQVFQISAQHWRFVAGFANLFGVPSIECHDGHGPGAA